MAELRCQIKRKSSYAYDDVYPRTKGEYNTFDNSGTDIVATNCQDAITELYGRIDSGKTPLANAITTMGQTTLSSATYSQMATNILNISDDANAVVGNVLTGKTFYQGGSKKTGTMVNNTTVSGTIGGLNSSNPTVPVRVGTNQNVSTQTVDGVTRLCYKAPQGYYDGNGYVGVAQADVASTIGLTAEKIVRGNTILGVSGSYHVPITSLSGYHANNLPGQLVTVNCGFRPKMILIHLVANNNHRDMLGTIYGEYFNTLGDQSTSMYYTTREVSDAKVYELKIQHAHPSHPAQPNEIIIRSITSSGFTFYTPTFDAYFSQTILWYAQG